MSRVSASRMTPPSAKPGAFPSPKPGRHGVIHAAAIVYAEQGARAAHLFLGGSIRAQLLLPKVFARVKWLARCEKRIQEATGIRAAELKRQEAA